MSKNILIIIGGTGPEREISHRSSKYLIEQTNKLGFNNILLELHANGDFTLLETQAPASFANGGIVVEHDFFEINFVIPCVHGKPGETGELQSFLEVYKLPYWGAGSEASILSFNKASTKFWLDDLSIPNTPYKVLASTEDIKKAEEMFFEHNGVLLKVTHGGSSIGVKHIDDQKMIGPTLLDFFKLSPYILAEKPLKNFRELEFAVYEFQGNLNVLGPAEIIVPGKEYTFLEKYSKDSKAQINLNPSELSNELIAKMINYAKLLFIKLKIKDLARVDFFLDIDTNELFLNEINTFPGMTDISVFPKLVDSKGPGVKALIEDAFNRANP